MLRKARLSPAISLFAALHLGTPAERAGSCWASHASRAPGFAKLVQRPLNLVKRERLHAPLGGQNWKRDPTPLLGENRRTRNLWNSARRCEHRATPSEFFQRDYSFGHERPHFILKCAVDRT